MALTVGTSSHAFVLNYQTSFALDTAPEGVAFDPVSGNFFVVDGFAVYEVDSSGNLLSGFTPGLSNVEGVDMLPNGNLLLVSQHGDNIVSEYTARGDAVTGGIAFATTPSTDNADGVTYSAATGTVFVTHSFAFEGAVYEFDAAGALLSAIDTVTLEPEIFDPEGLAVDPITGNLLVVSDAGGSSSLYEVAMDGRVVSSHDLAALTGMRDPEGVTVDPLSGDVYVAFNDEYSIATFSRDLETPTDDTPSTDDLPPPVAVNEPSTLALIGVGFVLLGLLWQLFGARTHGNTLPTKPHRQTSAKLG